ncbi:hypothetical protein AAEX28_08685 [Lentisphaerota bacterium WC36G]|nr:hypothetical protein LJT99_11540 [Lentisphaerae bacterium WC36]
MVNKSGAVRDGYGFLFLTHANRANVLFGDMHAETLDENSLNNIYMKKNNIHKNYHDGIKFEEYINEKNELETL